MKGLEAKTLGLKKMIRHEYKRIVAFMLTVAMVVTNFGTNLTVAFAAGEETSSLFLLDSSELEDAISTALESGEVFDFSSLELKAKQKSLKTSYEKLIGSKAGKVYQLDVDVDNSYASENTDLQVFYNAGTDSVVFLFINESEMAVTFRANVSGYETARVTVNPNTSNIEDAEGVENAEDYSNTTMVDDEKNQPKAEVVKPEGETSETDENGSDETEEETKADVTESETASENGETEETTGAENSSETEETTAAEETEAEAEETAEETEAAEPETEAPAAEEELQAEEGSATASISAKEVFRVSTSAEVAEETLADSTEEETEAETEAEAPEKETEALPETTEAEETVAEDKTEETTADESKADETTAADETADGETVADETKDGELVNDETEAPAENPADNNGDSSEVGFDGDEQFLEDDSIELMGELSGKAYNTVTIWGRANARAYAVKAEDLVGEAAVEGQYNVDYSVDPVGAAAIKGAHTVNEGETLYFAVDPQVGYEITEVTANGEELEEVDAAGVASASNLEKYAHVYAVEEVSEDLEIVASLEETENVAHPEFNASYVGSDGVTISLHAEEGILPEGTELDVTEVTEAIGDTIKEKMEGESEGAVVNKVLAYDINLLYNGEKLSNSWSEDGYVDVTFTGTPIQEMTETSDKVEIVAVDDTSKTQLTADKAETVEASELKLESVSEQSVEGEAVEEVGFKAEHFTIYAVTGTSGYGYITDAEKLEDITLSLDETQITIYTDKTDGGEGKWFSSNPSAVSVMSDSRWMRVKSDGVLKWVVGTTLTVVGPGRATIKYMTGRNYQNKKDSAEVTVTAPTGTHAVNWYVNGQKQKTTYVRDGEQPVYGGTPNRGDGDARCEFAGWAETQNSKDYVAESDLPAVTEDVSYFATFTSKAYFYFLLEGKSYTSGKPEDYMYAGEGKVLVPDTYVYSSAARWYDRSVQAGKAFDINNCLIEEPTDEACRTGLKKVYKNTYSDKWSYTLDWNTFVTASNSVGYDYKLKDSATIVHIDGSIILDRDTTAGVSYVVRYPDGTLGTQSKTHDKNSVIDVNSTVSTTGQFTTDGYSYDAIKSYNNVQYQFDGWYEDSNFTKKAPNRWTVTGTKTFYGRYLGGSRITYTGLDLFDTRNVNPGSYVKNQLPITLNDASANIAEFVGWVNHSVTGNDENANNVYFKPYTIPNSASGDLEYHALWKSEYRDNYIHAYDAIKQERSRYQQGYVDVEVYVDGDLQAPTNGNRRVYYTYEQYNNIDLKFDNLSKDYIVNTVYSKHGVSPADHKTDKTNVIMSGGLLDNVEDHSTVYIYLTPKYRVEYYADANKLTGSQYTQTDILTTEVTATKADIPKNVTTGWETATTLAELPGDRVTVYRGWYLGAATNTTPVYEEKTNFVVDSSKCDDQNVFKFYAVGASRTYEVSYEYVGDIHPVNEPAPPSTFPYPNGSMVPVFTEPEVEGYTFSGWTSEQVTPTKVNNAKWFTMPTENVKFVGHWTKNSYGYSVKYYYDGQLNESKTENLTAVYGTEINNYPDKNITGYKLDHVVGTPLTIGTDASENVIHVYYVKDSYGYSVKYYYDGQLDESKTENLTAVYGTEINDYPDKNITGYKLDHVVGTPLTIGIVASENVIHVYYVKDNFTYRVTYHYEDAKGKEIDSVTENPLPTAKYESEIRYTSDSQVTYKDVNYALDRIVKGNTNGADGAPIVTADEDINYVDIYYALDEIGEPDPEKPDGIPDKYQVVFTYVAEDHGVVTGIVKEVVTRYEGDKKFSTTAPAYPNADVTATPDNGYKFINWTSDNPSVASKDIVSVLSRVLQRYSATNAEFADVNAIRKSGFDQDTVFTAHFIASDATTYKVEVYYEHEGKYSSVPSKSVPMTGVTDTQATVKAEDYLPTSGYVFDQNAANVLSGTIAGDNSLVLKVYYKQVFKVTYAPGDHGSFKSQTYTVSYGDQTPGFSGDKTANGNYRFTGWDKTIESKVTSDIVYTAQWAANSNGGGNGGGGGGSSSGGGGGSSSGPRDNGSTPSGGPGATTVTIDPDAVPLANLPNEDGAADLLVIDDEDVPLAALPKTGQSGASGLVLFLSSMMLAAFVAVSKKREDDK